MQFSNTTTTAVGLALITLMLVSFAAIGTAAITEMENETVTFDSEENLTVEADWNDSASSSATADVSIYLEETWSADGTEASNYSGTLNGTVLEVNDSILSHATYLAELNQSEAGTVEVSASEFDNGTVDLSTQTNQNLTADDEVLSLTITANTVAWDSMASDPGNTTSVEFSTADGLEDGTDYRVIVEADDTAVESVSVDDGSGLLGGIFSGSDGSPGFGVGVAIVAIAAAMLARRRS